MVIHLIRPKSRYTMCNEPIVDHPFVVSTRAEFDKLPDEDRCPICDRIVQKALEGFEPPPGPEC
jgi:hypothetical protein